MFKLQELIRANMDTLAVRLLASLPPVPAPWLHYQAIGVTFCTATSRSATTALFTAWPQASVTKEQGKTLADARGDVFRGLEVVEFACGVGSLQARL